MPRKEKAKKQPKGPKARGPRRSQEEVAAILGEIDGLVAAGSTIKGALAQMGVAYSNYNYWRKRHGGGEGGRGRTAGLRRGRAGKNSVMAVLEEMTENRRERQQLEDAQKRIGKLDARFRELTRQLEKAGR